MPKDIPPMPVQPVVTDPHGTLRFKENRIVNTFREKASAGVKYDLNEAARDYSRGHYTQEEMVQFAQLIGYSVSGWADLSYVTSKDYARAQGKVRQLKKRRALEASRFQVGEEVMCSSFIGDPFKCKVLSKYLTTKKTHPAEPHIRYKVQEIARPDEKYNLDLAELELEPIK